MTCRNSRWLRSAWDRLFASMPAKVKFSWRYGKAVAIDLEDLVASDEPEDDGDNSNNEQDVDEVTAEAEADETDGPRDDEDDGDEIE